MHPSLKLEWYEELLRDLKARFPTVNLHAFSPPEIWHFHKLNKLPLRDGAAAAEGRRPGQPARRRRRDPRRPRPQGNHQEQGADRRVARGASASGTSSAAGRTCTMMFGHIETDRRAHRTPRPPARSCRTRPAASPRSSAGRCSPATRWPTSPQAGAFEYLRTQAIARLYLDNIPNIQSSWVTQGGEDRPARPLLRGQRHGQPDDRGERRRVGRHGALPDAEADQARDPRGRATSRGSGTSSTN